MTVKCCDFCGKPIESYERRLEFLHGAISDMTGAEIACEACELAINKIDWNDLVRSAIESEKE